MLPRGRNNFEDDKITLNISKKEMDDIMSTYHGMGKEEFEKILNEIIKRRQIPNRELFKKIANNRGIMFK